MHTNAQTTVWEPSAGSAAPETRRAGTSSCETGGRLAEPPVSRPHGTRSTAAGTPRAKR